MGRGMRKKEERDERDKRDEGDERDKREVAIGSLSELSLLSLLSLQSLNSFVLSTPCVESYFSHLLSKSSLLCEVFDCALYILLGEYHALLYKYYRHVGDCLICATLG